MTNKDLTISLPDEMVKQLKLNDGDTLSAVLKNDSLIIQENDSNEPSSLMKFLWSLLPALFSSVMFLLYFGTRNQTQIKFGGGYSIASSIIILGVIVGMILFGIFFVQARQHSTNRMLKNIYWRNFPTIIVSIALILLLVLLGIFWVFGIIFPDISFDLVTATGIVLIFCFFIYYIMIEAASRISPLSLTTVFAGVIMIGVIISMASNGNRHWWEHNLSFLGTNLAKNSWQFNLTLIFSALIMIVLVDYLFVSLRPYFRGKRLMTLRVLLTMTAVCLGAIGVFTNDKQFHFIHDQIATTLSYLVLLMIVGIRWMLPKITREFLGFSYIIGGILVAVSIAFKPIGYLSLTGYELLAFISVFGWVLILFQQLQALTQPEGLKFTVRVSTKN